MDTKITHRKSGWTALVTYPWGEKVRFIGCESRDRAQELALAHIEAARRVYPDGQIGITSAAAAMGRVKSERKAKSSAENGRLGGRRTYAIERYTSTIHVFRSVSARDAWLSAAVNPAVELRAKISLRDAEKLRDKKDFVRS